jgi:16S rRNA (cytosine967-C5)-methyltransferase
MQNKGQIIALDIFEWKLAELKSRAKRAGAHNIETRMISDNKVIKTS